MSLIIERRPDGLFRAQSIPDLDFDRREEILISGVRWCKSRYGPPSIRNGWRVGTFSRYVYFDFKDEYEATMFKLAFA